MFLTHIIQVLQAQEDTCSMNHTRCAFGASESKTRILPVICHFHLLENLVSFIKTLSKTLYYRYNDNIDRFKSIN